MSKPDKYRERNLDPLVHKMVFSVLLIIETVPLTIYSR